MVWLAFHLTLFVGRGMTDVDKLLTVNDSRNIADTPVHSDLPCQSTYLMSLVATALFCLQ